VITFGPEASTTPELSKPSVIDFAISELQKVLTKIDGGWTDASVGDVLQGCTPFTMSLFIRSCGDSEVIGTVMRKLGSRYRVDPKVKPYAEILGRPYINVSGYFCAAFGGWPFFPSCSPSGAAKIKFGGALKLPLSPFFVIRDLYSICVGLAKNESEFLRNLSTKDEDFRQKFIRLKQVDLTKLSLAELEIRYAEVSRYLFEASVEHLMSDFLAAGSEFKLRVGLSVFGAQAYFTEFTKNAKNNFNLRCNRDLVELKKQAITWDEFCERYGHRGSPDWEVSAPRWRQNKSLLEPLFEDLKEISFGKMPAPVSASKGVWFQIGIKMLSKRAEKVKNLIAARESTQNNCYRGIDLMGEVMREIASRVFNGTPDPDLIFQLSIDQFEALLKQTVQNDDRLKSWIEVAMRQEKYWKMARLLPLPHHIARENLDQIGLVQTDCSVQKWIGGKTVFSGDVTGRARVVENIRDIRNLESDEIVITRFADPAWSAILTQCRGFVMEQGSTLSHIAILAREYNVPSAVGFSGICGQLRDGMLIRLNSDKGEVQIVRK